ncbi:MAG: ABC transporter permease [Thermoplasmata archaeon]
MASFRRILTRRVFNAIVTILLIALVNFLLFRVMPGDPAAMYLPRNPDQDTMALYWANVERMELNGTLPEQLVSYFIDTFTGEWGYSYLSKRPVTEVVAVALSWTALLLTVSSVLTFLIGIILGKTAARRRGKPADLVITGIGLFFYGMPIFWFGIMLMVLFSTELGILPSGGYITPGTYPSFDPAAMLDIAIHLVLPVATLVIGGIAGIILIQRNSLIDVLTEDYITTAYAKGLSEKQVMRRHATQNARLPIVTTMAMDMAFILGGAFQVEWVFSYKGIGWVTIDAIGKKDYPVLQFVFLIGGIAVVLANLIADLVLVKLDPRVSIT